MLDCNEDRWSYLVTIVIFMAAVNPPTTTIIPTPVRNWHETKNLQGNIFASILATLSISLGTITMNLVQWPSAIYLHGKQRGVNRFGARWPPPISKTTSIQLNFEKPQTMLNELRFEVCQNICVRNSPVNA